MTCEVLFIILVAFLQEVGGHVLGSVLCAEMSNNAILSQQSQPTEFDYSGFHSAL